jgi:hypothetical protein
LAFVVVAVAFTVGIAGLISYMDARGGGLLSRYFEEYAGGGSCKWRGPEGQNFQLLLTLGLLAWPAGIAASAVGLAGLVSARTSSERRRAAAGAVVVTALVTLALARLVSLRAVAGAMEQCWV